MLQRLAMFVLVLLAAAMPCVMRSERAGGGWVACGDAEASAIGFGATQRFSTTGIEQSQGCGMGTGGGAVCCCTGEAGDGASGGTGATGCGCVAVPDQPGSDESRSVTPRRSGVEEHWRTVAGSATELTGILPEPARVVVCGAMGARPAQKTPSTSARLAMLSVRTT